MIDEDLIKYAWPQDVWFHVDKLSSAHVYVRMPTGMTWETIPEAVLTDCAQLVKANSIEGELRVCSYYSLLHFLTKHRLTQAIRKMISPSFILPVIT
jgi:hypothetical protein